MWIIVFYGGKMGELLIIAGALLVFMVITSVLSKKKQSEHNKNMNEGLVPGAWVQTIGGFCGKVVETDGDVVVLATPSGEESLWLRRAIARIEEPPFAIDDVENDSEVEENEVTQLENETSQASETELVEKVESSDEVKPEEETNKSEENIKEEK